MAITVHGIFIENNCTRIKGALTDPDLHHCRHCQEKYTRKDSMHWNGWMFRNEKTSPYSKDNYFNMDLLFCYFPWLITLVNVYKIPSKKSNQWKNLHSTDWTGKGPFCG